MSMSILFRQMRTIVFPSEQRIEAFPFLSCSKKTPDDSSICLRRVWWWWFNGEARSSVVIVVVAVVDKDPWSSAVGAITDDDDGAGGWGAFSSTWTKKNRQVFSSKEDRVVYIFLSFVCPFLRSVVGNSSEDLAMVMLLMTFSSVLLGRRTSTPTSILMSLSGGWKLQEDLSPNVRRK